MTGKKDIKPRKWTVISSARWHRAAQGAAGKKDIGPNTRDVIGLAKTLPFHDIRSREMCLPTTYR